MVEREGGKTTITSSMAAATVVTVAVATRQKLVLYMIIVL